MSPDLRSIHRSALQLALRLATLLQDYPGGATYQGIARALGMRSRSAVRALVLRAESHGLVDVRPTGRGPRMKTVVRLSAHGRGIVDSFSRDRK